MRKIPAVLGVCIVVSQAGCGFDTKNSTNVAGIVVLASEATQTFSNGHPLVLPTSEPAILALEAEVVGLVNAHRVSIGLNALVSASDVADLARGNSAHMIVHRYFAHTTPEGVTLGGRFNMAGLVWTQGGENIAAGFGTPVAAFNAWMASPGHRENIEYAAWTHTGVGYMYDPLPTADWPYGHYWTQNFLKQ